MPITKSAKKAMRQSERRRVRNLKRARAYKSAVRAYRRAASTGDTAKAVGLLPAAYQALDKAAKTRVIAKNKASRLKSRLTKHAAENAARP